MIDKGLIYLIYKLFIVIHEKNFKILIKKYSGEGDKDLEQGVHRSDAYMKNNVHIH